MRPFKALSTAASIDALAVPRRLTIAMIQQAGPPARPLVRPGDRVLCGQPIGAAAGPGSVAVHASGSGTVVGLEERLVPTGSRLVRSPCVVVEIDGADDALKLAAAPPARWSNDATMRLQAIRDAGLVGLGGAAFSTAIKLGPSRPCRTLILNGAECEPYISCDDMLMRERADSILRGAAAMLELLQAPTCIVAVERDKLVALDAVRAAITALGDDRFSLAAIPTIYPAGGERQLVESLLGVEVPAGAYPVDLGIVCQNVGTAHALADFLELGRPLISRIVTMTGHGLRRPQNVEAPIGASIRDLIAHCGGLTEDATQLILGGNMMGYALPSDDIPVTKSTNCVIALAEDEAWQGGHEWPCIRCGDCATACPARLLPQELLRAARRSSAEDLAELGLEDCIECGCCDVACPSHIPLTSILRAAKDDLDAHLERRRRGAVADDRYARHVAREANAAAKWEREQLELTAPLQDPESRRTAIEAAIARTRKRRSDSGQDE